LRGVVEGRRNEEPRTRTFVWLDRIIAVVRRMLR